VKIIIGQTIGIGALISLQYYVHETLLKDGIWVEIIKRDEMTKPEGIFN